MIYGSRRVEDWTSEILAISAWGGGEEMILPKKANLAMVNPCQGEIITFELSILDDKFDDFTLKGIESQVDLDEL